MPYIKLNPAQYGAANTVEPTDDGTRAAVSGIILKPVSQTRGVVITDSTVYEVSVAFNLTLESVNTQEKEEQTLSFEVNYIGVVEDAREMPDPEIYFDYELNVLGGTKSYASPYRLTLGKTLSLQWKQSAVYSYFSLADNGMMVINCEPEMVINLSAATDTLVVTKAEDLEKITLSDPVISSSEENPSKTSVTQVFDIGGQKVSADWSYEAYTETLSDGEKIELPHLQLGELKLVDVSTKLLPDVEISGKYGEVYEVTAKFSQDVTSVNVTPEVQQTVEYIVKYIGFVEFTLVDVGYRKDYAWVVWDGTDTWCKYILYRDRTYSNGKTITDTFISTTFFFMWGVGAEFPYMESYEGEFTVPGGYATFYYTLVSAERISDSIRGIFKTRVPQIDAVSAKIVYDEYQNGMPGEFNRYKHTQGGFAFNEEEPTDGWYERDISRNLYANAGYDLGSYIYSGFHKYQLELHFPDQFIYIDDQLIDFLEYRMTYDINLNEERTTTGEGYPAKVYTFDCKSTYLGRDFYFAVIDTIYQDHQ